MTITKITVYIRVRGFIIVDFAAFVVVGKRSKWVGGIGDGRGDRGTESVHEDVFLLLGCAELLFDGGEFGENCGG